MGIPEQLIATARRQTEKVAVIFGSQAITYRQLDYRARDLARWYLRQGLKPGDRVAVLWGNAPEALYLLLGCFHAGLIAMPVNTRLKSAEVANQLGHARPSMFFAQPQFAATAEAALAEWGGDVALRTELPPPGDDELAPMPPAVAEQPCLLMYTSGTTARPKGVVHTHATIAAAVDIMRNAGWQESDCCLNSVPLMHISGLVGIGLSVLTSGAAMVLLAGFDPAAALDALDRHRCTVSFGLPAMMQFLCAEQERAPRAVSSLRLFFSGGDTVPVSLQVRFQRLFGIPLLEAYAMTETCLITSNRPDAFRPGSIGRLTDGVAARVLDFTGRDVADGEVGEMAVRSPGNFAGYWNDPAATAATLVDGWMLTGDLVHRDPDGFYWFAGRRKEIIVRGGSNISPQEVEEALYRHPSILEAGVIGMPDPVYNERVVACVSLREGRTASAEELRDYVRASLADYKVPERVVFLPALPKGLTGKVQRRALKEMAQE